MKQTRAERRREHIEALIRADPSRSNRSIAQEIGQCSHNTVARVRGGLPGPLTTGDGPANVVRGQNPGAANLIEPAGPGNARAATHGAYSAARREPLEQQHREALRLAYPTASDALLNASAKRLSMIDLFSAWISDAGAVHPVRGQPVVSDPARELRRLLNDHEHAIERLEASEATGGAGRRVTLADIEAEPDGDEDLQAGDGHESEANDDR
jgi:hypothetical protein